MWQLVFVISSSSDAHRRRIRQRACNEGSSWVSINSVKLLGGQKRGAQVCALPREETGRTQLSHCPRTCFAKQTWCGLASLVHVLDRWSAYTQLSASSKAILFCLVGMKQERWRIFNGASLSVNTGHRLLERELYQFCFYQRSLSSSVQISLHSYCWVFIKWSIAILFNTLTRL